jgi:hypothetical protein
MADSPSNNIPFVPENTIDPAAGLNLAINVIDALLNTRVENMTTNAPPGSPADGVMYVVGGSPTGAWAGHADAFARYVAEGTFWEFYEAGVEAWLVLNKSDGNLYKWDEGSTSWIAAAGIGDAPLDGLFYGRRLGTWEEVPGLTNPVLSVAGVGPDTSGDIVIVASDLPYDNSTSGLSATDVQAAIDEVAVGALQSLVAACSDETTALVAGTAKVTFRNPYATAFIVTHVKASLTTAQVGGSIFTVDINEAGTSILSTKITIDNTEKTSETAAAAPVVSDASIAADAEITVDVDQVGDGTAKGLKIYIIGHLA